MTNDISFFVVGFIIIAIASVFFSIASRAIVEGKSFTAIVCVVVWYEIIRSINFLIEYVHGFI